VSGRGEDVLRILQVASEHMGSKPFLGSIQWGN
jgi:hypothetical protein